MPPMASARPKTARTPKTKAAATPEAGAEEAPGELAAAEPTPDADEPSEADLKALESEPDATAEEGQAALVPAARVPQKALLPFRSRGTDPLSQYMAEVGRHPLLTREEEHELAVQYAKTGDVKAAYTLVQANLRLVVKLAFEYHRTAFNVLDLVQEGNVGLMHAVKKFDPYKGVKLSTYAAWWIRAFILRHIMENWRMVKLGTTQAQRKLFFNLRKEKERLAQQGFEVGPKLLAERLQVSEQDVVDMDIRMSQDEFSLDAPLSDDSDSTHQDRLAFKGAAVDDRLADNELHEIFRRELAEFGKTIKDEKERFIFEKRLTADEPLKLQEIGDKYGVTRERARQIEAKLTNKLRVFMQERIPDFEQIRIGGGED